MQKIVIFFCLFAFAFLWAEESHKQYQFLGKHFIASYKECDPEAMQNVKKLIAAVREGVRQSGAQVLNEAAYVFPGNGLTMAFLLSESHATIHTYPEHRACFVDLFTCGDHCDYRLFDETLRAYLMPQAVEAKVLIRDDKITEDLLRN